jgi:hypothetical protein
MVMYANFLVDPEIYDLLAKRWADRWSKLLKHHGAVEAWKTAWISVSFANGTPMRDGNPIFSAINKNGRIAVRIIQEEPSESEEKITHWINTTENGDQLIKELVISLELTPETERQAWTWISSWVLRKMVESGNRSAIGMVYQPNFDVALCAV